jgi:hypothetical protein
MRLYGPEMPILDGSYRLPGVQRVELTDKLRVEKTLLKAPSQGDSGR